MYKEIRKILRGLILMRKIIIFFNLLFFINILSATKIEIKNNKLYVNDNPFIIKGICYGPIPAGEESTYKWDLYPALYNTDFPLIKDMGANCIRTYNEVTKKDALDAAYKNGLYVIMEMWVNWYGDFSDSTFRSNEINKFKDMVEKWKSHPAVLMWSFGHELIYWKNKYGSGSDSDVFTLIEEAAKAAHEVEGQNNFHPVISPIGDMITNKINKSGEKSTDADMSDLDIWAVQVYRGTNLHSVFTDYENLGSKKPLIITETGCDAYDAKNHKEEQTQQALYIQKQWEEIDRNLIFKDSSKDCIGVTFFSWADGWWKYTGGSANLHNTNGSWPNGNYYDYVTGKSNMNEEWWGITSIFPGTYEKTPRKAYYTLKSYWNKSSDDDNNLIDNILFRKISVNIPNPFNLSNDEYTDIWAYLNYESEVTMQIFDYSGKLIKSFNSSDLDEYAGYKYTARWDGTDNNGNRIRTGLYICKITAKYKIKDSYQTEKQYIKMAVIR